MVGKPLLMSRLKSAVAGREMAFVSDIGSMMEEYGIEPLGLLDYEETLPGLRAATEYAAQCVSHLQYAAAWSFAGRNSISIRGGRAKFGSMSEPLAMSSYISRSL